MDDIWNVVTFCVWFCFNLHGSWIDGERLIGLTCAVAVMVGTSSSTCFAVVTPFCITAAVLQYVWYWRLGVTNPLVEVWGILGWWWEDEWCR
jgi:hypothetical protein